MEPVHEERVGDLVVRIDRRLCVGFGDCVQAAPELWELDEEGIAVLRSPLPEPDRERLLRSCEVCPVDALSVCNAAGNQLVP